MEDKFPLMFTLDDTEPIIKVGPGLFLTPKGREALVETLVDLYRASLDLMSDNKIIALIEEMNNT